MSSLKTETGYSLICDVCSYGEPKDPPPHIRTPYFHLCDDCLAALKEMVSERRKGKEPFKNIKTEKKFHYKT